MSDPKASKGKEITTEKSILKKVTDEEHLIVQNDSWPNKSDYNSELGKLQIELVKMQRWIQDTDNRVVIIFEGRCIRKRRSH